MYVVIDMAIACSIVYTMSFVIDSSSWGEFAFRTIIVLVGNIARNVDSFKGDQLVNSVMRAHAACQE